MDNLGRTRTVLLTRRSIYMILGFTNYIRKSAQLLSMTSLPPRNRTRYEKDLPKIRWKTEQYKTSEAFQGCKSFNKQTCIS